MNYVEALRSVPWVGGGRPYLVNVQQKSQLHELLPRLGLRLVTVEVPLGGDIPGLLTKLSEALEFPEPPSRGWDSFNDYYWDFVRSESVPVAVVLNGADGILKKSVRRFVAVVHHLLSITEEIGLTAEDFVPIEFFFVGEWSCVE